MKTFVYVGNWDRHKAGPNGFGICGFNPETGGLELVKSAFPDITVGAACVDPRRSILYCTDECTTLPGNFLGGGGQVYAFAIDLDAGDLTLINHRPSYGALPSSIAMDPAGLYLIATHHTDRIPVTKVVEDAPGKYRIALEYDDATTVLFPLDERGAIGDPCDIYKHSGDGGPLAKQTHPQLHSVTVSPSGKLFAVCDKGNDEIVLFRINQAARKLEPCGPGVKSIPGSSPRYSAFHPTHPWLFVNHETKAVVTSFRYDDEGKLEPVCSVSALPANCVDDPSMHQSDLQLHPSGKYLYSMVRGIHAVSAFRVAEDTGMLEMFQSAPIEGKGPRGCALSPDGRFMIIAALSSQDVLVWAVAGDGRLIPTGQGIKQPNPGSIIFFPPT